MVLADSPLSCIRRDSGGGLSARVLEKVGDGFDGVGAGPSHTAGTRILLIRRGIEAAITRRGVDLRAADTAARAWCAWSNPAALGCSALLLNGDCSVSSCIFGLV